MVSLERSFVLLPSSGYAVQKWANGLGMTREIAADRSAPGPDDPSSNAPLRWRLSMADLTAPGGPFSRIDGVDRSLTLLTGEPVTLTVDGGDPVTLELEEPFSFLGDVETSSVVSCAGRDFNAMWDRTRMIGNVHVVRCAQSEVNRTATVHAECSEHEGAVKKQRTGHNRELLLCSSAEGIPVSGTLVFCVALAEGATIQTRLLGNDSDLVCTELAAQDTLQVNPILVGQALLIHGTVLVVRFEPRC